MTSITLTTGVSIDCGSAWAQFGAVTLDTNLINGICAFSAFGDVLGPTATANERAVAAALDAYVTGGGTLPLDFQSLLDLLTGLTDEDQAAVYNQLAGQTATGAAATGMQAMDFVPSQMFDSAFAEDEDSPETAPNQPPGTVRALGYADEKRPTAVDAVFFSLRSNPTGRTVWASAYGSRGHDRGRCVRRQQRSVPVGIRRCGWL